MDFKVGQIVELINSDGMVALKGATAIVTKTTPWLSVKWLTKSCGQVDGGYCKNSFKPLLEKNVQLLFSFMEK